MKKQKGQSLVEALIALGAAAIIVSAITIASITAVNNADFSKYQNLATHYAQQGLEILRQNSQASWTTNIYNRAGDPPGIDYCLGQDNILADLNTPPTCAPNITDNKGNLFFSRQITLERIAYSSPSNPGVDTYACNGGVKAIVYVSWTDGKCGEDNFCHNVTLSSCFANVNQILP